MSELQYGVTGPISTNLPSDVEKRSNESLLTELTFQRQFETPLGITMREEVLANLEIIVNLFVVTVARELHPDQVVLIRDARGKVFTYGSYRLGVFGPGSDIDTICIAPKYVTIDHFFKYLPGLLCEMTEPGEIKDMKSVREAFVPIIKFEYRNISIDLIFSSIKSLQQLPSAKDWTLQDVGLLRGMTEQEAAALNGPRVTDDVLRSVPEQTTFRLALRAIKFWSKRRGLYGAIYGFPGGVAWAICVARICQLYPKATSSVIVDRFFRIFKQWPWPQPVLLKQMDDRKMGMKMWNPKIYSGDMRHRMPIITPSYPAFCTTHNVTQSAFDVINQEMARGAELADDMVLGKRPWNELFAKHNFFTGGFKFYLTITSISRSEEAHKPWSGFIESRSRHLAMDVENHPDVVLARPFIDVYDRVHLCKTNAEVEQIEAGSLAFVVKDVAALKAKLAVKAARAKVKAEAETAAKAQAGAAKTEVEVAAAVKDDAARAEINGKNNANKTVKVESNGESQLASDAVKEEGKSGVRTEDDNGDKPWESSEDEEGLGKIIYSTTQFIGLALRDKVKSIDFSFQCNRFVRDCTNWDKFREGIMTLRIQHLAAWSLPDDVFEAGEIKPEKPPKKKRPAPSEDVAHPAKRQQTAAASAA